MCGIAGILRPNGLTSVDPHRLDKMTSVMEHRGPDGGGAWHDSVAAIGHVRLSIIDLSGGRQPMLSSNGRYVLTYNGELYNYKELRETLLHK